MIKLGLVRLSVARKDDGGQVFVFEHLGIPVPPRAGVRGSGVRFRTRHRAPWTWERSTPPARACEKQAPYMPLETPNFVQRENLRAAGPDSAPLESAPPYPLSAPAVRPAGAPSREKDGGVSASREKSRES